MDDILDYLEQLTQKKTPSPEYYDLLREMDPLTDQIKEALSLEFLDKLNYAEAGFLNLHSQEAFSRGFRLGARLMLALAEPSAEDTHHRSSPRR